MRKQRLMGVRRDGLGTTRNASRPCSVAVYAVSWLTLLGCASIVTPSRGDDASVAQTDGAARDVVVAPDDIETLPEAAAESVCSALFRCCDSSDRQLFFEGLELNERASPELRASLPPADEAACRGVVAAALRTAVFADWIDAARRGLVEYDPDASLACRRTLAEASCGERMSRALFDPTCFVLYDSGFQHRRMFRRVATDGAPCRLLREWQYPVEFYGTCDPSVAFCCVPDPEFPSGCLDNFGSRRLGMNDGHCRAASRLGEACAGPLVLSPDHMQLCASGLTCGLRSHLCAARDPTTPLSLGDRCYDGDDGHRLGTCPDGALSCDLYREPGGGFASDRCISLADEGSPCESNYQCRSTRCVGLVCVAPQRYCPSR